MCCSLVFSCLHNIFIHTFLDTSPQLRWESEAANKYSITVDDSTPIEGSGTRLVRPVGLETGARLALLLPSLPLTVPFLALPRTVPSFPSLPPTAPFLLLPLTASYPTPGRSFT